jgi:hypothetical protein
MVLIFISLANVTKPAHLCHPKCSILTVRQIFKNIEQLPCLDPALQRRCPDLSYTIFKTPETRKNKYNLLKAWKKGTLKIRRLSFIWDTRVRFH